MGSIWKLTGAYFWASWGPSFRCLLGPPGIFLGRKFRIIGSCCSPLWPLLGPSWGSLALSWSPLGLFWNPLGPSSWGGGPLGGLLVGHLGRPLGPRGQSWSVGSSDRQARRTCTQRKNIITSWSPLGRPPGTLSGPRGGFMGHRLGAILGVVERSRRARRSARERPENLRCWGPDCRGMRGGGRGGGRRAREENPPPSGGLALLTGEP